MDSGRIIIKKQNQNIIYFPKPGAHRRPENLLCSTENTCILHFVILASEIDFKDVINLLFFCIENRRIREHEVGSDLLDHLVQLFLAKAQSRQEVPAPSPATPQVSGVGESTTALGRLLQQLTVLGKNFPLVPNRSFSRSNMYLLALVLFR